MTKSELEEKLVLSPDDLTPLLADLVSSGKLGDWSENTQIALLRSIEAQVQHILDNPENLALIAKEYGWVKLADDQTETTINETGDYLRDLENLHIVYKEEGFRKVIL